MTCRTSGERKWLARKAWTCIMCDHSATTAYTLIDWKRVFIWVLARPSVPSVLHWGRFLVFSEEFEFFPLWVPEWLDLAWFGLTEMVQASGRNVRDIPNVLLNLDDCTPPFISSAKCVRFILYIFFIDVGTEESGTRGKFIRAADSTKTRQSCEKTPPVSQLALSFPWV